MTNKILITGGNFINKGAQSMLFCLVDSLKKKYPKAEIIMIDLFPTQMGEAKNQYTFTIMNMHIRTLLRMAFPFLKLIVAPKPISDHEKVIQSHFKTADIIYDISGYGVSSHNQKPIWTYATLFPVKWAKKYKVPFVFLPQSIGPFNFKGWKKMVIWPLVKKYLQYPEYIFIREPQCRAYLEPIKTKQVIDSFDLVLQSDKIDPHHIFKNSTTLQSSIPKQIDSVIVIPNKQLCRIIPEEKVIQLFSSLIQSLLDNNEHVSIVRHSADDKAICDSIFKEVKNDRVLLINEDLNPMELQEIFDASKMVVAARYHGLIHALKLSKPCLVIGWANKYNTVMDGFELSKFYFNITNAKSSDINNAAHEMLAQLPTLESNITTKLQQVKNSSIYQYI